jgi:Flp pilus assembly protein TadD
LKRSSLAIAAAALAVIVGVAGWWTSRPRPKTGPAPPGARSVPEVVGASGVGRPVLFVGLDGADWELLDRFLAAGAMPNLAGLVREGTAGVLETIHPPLSPLVWTTMMTGRSPLDHAILDFTRFNPRSGQKEPITSDERQEPAIWNMATYGGKRVASLGLWATYPAEAVNGLVVSDRLFTFLFKEAAPPPGIVFPSSREAWAREGLRRAEEAVGLAELRAYLPWLDEATYRASLGGENPYGHPVSALRRILVETRVFHDLWTDWVAKEKPDLAILYVQGTDSIGHVFAPYAPPRQTEIAAEDYDRYHDVPERYFRHVDGLIGEYRKLAEVQGAALMLASDHGFRWTEGRPTTLSSVALATAAKWHRDEGMYVLWGPGIAKGAGHGLRGSVSQVCATLLALLGLPAGRGVAGPPLQGAPASAAVSVEYHQWYKPAAQAAPTSAADEETLAKLRALGYVGATEAGRAPVGARGSTRTAGSYNNEGLLWKNRGNDEKAIAAYEQALVVDPDLTSAAWNLSELMFAQAKDRDRADALLLRALGHGLPEGTKFVVARAIAYQREGQPARSVKLMSEATKVLPDEPEVWLFAGRYRIEEGNCAGALSDFRQAVRLQPANPAAHASVGLAELCLGDRANARRSFLRSLELDPNQPKVRAYLTQL